MSIGKWVTGTVIASAGLLLYGALVETERLACEYRTLRLPGWPDRLAGYRIGFFSDMHLSDRGTERLTQRAIEFLLREQPDVVVIGGDFVSRWTDRSVDQLISALEPLSMLSGRVVGVPGNRDYYGGDPDLLEIICSYFDIKLLRNSAWLHDDIQFLGIDSANAEAADPAAVLGISDPDEIARVILWHEPDVVDTLPAGAAHLMLSGHSHGGQFTTPWGWAPVRSRNGEKYMRGFFPQTPVPLYVSRGLGTTGPPSRLFCRPEVTILTLEPA